MPQGWTPVAEAPAAPAGWTPVAEAPTFQASNEKDANGNAVVSGGGARGGLLGTKVDPATLPADVRAELEAIAQGKGNDQPWFANVRAMLSAWGEAGPHAVVEGIRNLTRGNYARGARQVMSGTAITAAPMVAPGLVAGAAAAPMATAAGLAGGLATQQVVSKGGEALGLTPDQAGLAGDLAGIAGGALASKVPGAVAARAVPALREGAATKVEQALGATKERYKAMAKRLTPELLKRGLGGSRESLLAKAQTAVETTGQQIDDAIAQFGPRSVTLQPVMTALEQAKAAFRTVANGRVVEFEPRAIKQLDDLQQTLAQFGPDIRVDQLIAVRRAWDKVVDQAGGFAHRAGGAIGVPLKDQSEAWAKREATGAIRKLLADEVPELAAINKEYSFWKGLDDVLSQTLDRAAPQQGSLRKQIAQGFGAVVASKSGVGPAWAAGKLAGLAHQVFTSPRWRLVDAQMRNHLADALASGSATRVQGALNRIAATQAVAGSVTTARPALTPATAEGPDREPSR